MSLEQDVMDTLLVRLNEILPLARQETRAIPLGDGGAIKEGDLPFAQVFSTETVQDAGEVQSSFATITFGLEVLAEKDQKTVLRDALEQLSVELTRNPTLDGLVRSASLNRTVVERLDKERAFVAGAVTVEYVEDYLETGDELLVDFAEDIAEILFPGGVGGLSPVIPGALGVQKTNAGQVSVTFQSFGSASMLTDLTAFPFFRAAFYVPEEIRDKVDFVEFQIFDGTFALNNYQVFNVHHGWNLQVIDRDNPDVDGSLDFSDIIAIQLAVNMNEITDLMDEESFLLYRLWATARDKAGVDVAPGF